MTACGAVHVPAHQTEYRPGGKAFQSQEGFGSGNFPDAFDLFQIFEQFRFVNQIIGCFKIHGFIP